MLLGLNFLSSSAFSPALSARSFIHRTVLRSSSSSRPGLIGLLSSSRFLETGLRRCRPLHTTSSMNWYGSHVLCTSILALLSSTRLCGPGTRTRVHARAMQPSFNVCLSGMHPPFLFCASECSVHPRLRSDYAASLTRLIYTSSPINVGNTTIF